MREPRLRWVLHDQLSLSAQWQEALQEARGDFFLPLTTGTIAQPRLLEKLVRGLQRDDLLAGITCHAQGYHDARQQAREDWVGLERATGGSRLLACLENVFGEGPTLYRTKVLREIGGFDLDAPCGPAGWGLAVKLLHHGYPVDVAPELLAQVHVSRDSSRRVTELYQLHRYLLEQYVSTWTLSPQETTVLWSALSGTHRTILDQSRRLGRLERIRRAAQTAVQLLGRLVPEPGQRWLSRAWSRLQRWWGNVVGKREPWRYPTPGPRKPVFDLSFRPERTSAQRETMNQTTGRVCM